MSANTLSRDARHLALPQIGAQGQLAVPGDATATEFRRLAIRKRSDCPACAENR